MLSLLFISSINASEISDSNLTDSNNVEIISSSEYSFRDLQNSINNDNNIFLTNDVKHFENDVNGILINKEVTINGNGHVINANFKGNVFNISEKGILTLNNVKIINSNYDDNITNPDNIDYEVESGDVDYNYGGYKYAIYNKGKLFINNNVIFENNLHGSIYNGVDATAIIVGNSKFINNKNYSAISNHGNMTIGGTVCFKNNSRGAINHGGANFVGRTLTIKDSVSFINNSNIRGGAIFTWTGFLNIYDDVSFINNRAISEMFHDEYYDEEYEWGGDGGAICISEGFTTINGNVKFINNTANVYGGALSINGNITLKNALFDNNDAKYAGAIFLADSGSNLGYCGHHTRIINATFSNNHVEQTGSSMIVFYNDEGFNSYIKISDCNFINNYETNKSSSLRNYSGSVFLSSKNGEILNNMFNNNKAIGYGGALTIIDSSNVKLSNNKFINNFAKIKGDSIAIFNSELSISNSNFNNNTLYNNGSIYLSKNKQKNSRYSIINQGNLSLDKNEFDNPIYNQGKIKTATNVFILNNKTIEACVNKNLRLNATIIDDNNNQIITDKFNFKVNDKYFNAILKDNKFIYDLMITEGTYLVSTQLPILGLSNTNLKNGIILGKYDGGINAVTENITVGKNAVINISFTKKDVSGNVKTTIDGKEYSSKINDASALIIIPDLEYGEYELSIDYSGDTKYLSDSIKVNLFVDDENHPILKVDNLTMYYRSGERLIVKLYHVDGKPISHESVSIIINENKYTRTTDENGVASMAINLNSGKYNVTTQYKNLKVYSTIIIKDTIISNDFTKIFRNGTQYSAKFLDSQGNLLKNIKVTFNINGVIYTRTTDTNGVAKMNINLNPGTYILTATNTVNGENHANTIKVLSNIAENNDLTKYYKNASQYVIRLLDDRGKPVGAGVSVEFNINGVFYTRTSNATGHVKMNINLNPDTYIITVKYKGLMTSNTITVKPILQAKDLIMKYKDGSKFEVKLLDGRGKAFASQKITFNINGVFYDRTTDASGIARLNINLMAGQYIITSMYSNGAATSNKVTISS